MPNPSCALLLNSVCPSPLAALSPATKKIQCRKFMSTLRDRQTDRQTDRLTDRQTDRQTDSQTRRETDRQTDRPGFCKRIQTDCSLELLWLWKDPCPSNQCACCLASRCDVLKAYKKKIFIAITFTYSARLKTFSTSLYHSIIINDNSV